MNAYYTVAIPFLCCAVSFSIIGMTMGNTTFLSLSAGFLAAGIPMLVVGFNRKRVQTDGK